MTRVNAGRRRPRKRRWTNRLMHFTFKLMLLRFVYRRFRPRRYDGSGGWD